jgi:hypothetical protein
MNTNKLNKILGGTYCFWGMLGFYRGTQEYDFENKVNMKLYDKELLYYNRQSEKYKKDKIEYPMICFSEPKPPMKPNHFYITRIMYGFYGAIVYAIPFTGAVCLMKEIYRIEINLRNFDDEKKTKFYNTIYGLW